MARSIASRQVSCSVAVLEAVKPDAPACDFPGVTPGAAVHFYAAGGRRGRRLGGMARAMADLDRLEGEGVDLGSVERRHFRAAADLDLQTDPPEAAGGQGGRLEAVERALRFFGRLEAAGFDLALIESRYYRDAAEAFLERREPDVLTWADYGKMLVRPL